MDFSHSVHCDRVHSKMYTIMHAIICYLIPAVVVLSLTLCCSFGSCTKITGGKFMRNMMLASNPCNCSTTTAFVKRLGS